MNTYIFHNDPHMAADRKFYIRVHKKGCRSLKNNDHIWDIQAKTVLDAVAIQIQDFKDQDMGAFNYNIEPCLKHEVNRNSKDYERIMKSLGAL